MVGRTKNRFPSSFPSFVVRVFNCHPLFGRVSQEDTVQRDIRYTRTPWVVAKPSEQYRHAQPMDLSPVTVAGRPYPQDPCCSSSLQVVTSVSRPFLQKPKFSHLSGRYRKWSENLLGGRLPRVDLVQPRRRQQPVRLTWPFRQPYSLAAPPRITTGDLPTESPADTEELSWRPWAQRSSPVGKPNPQGSSTRLYPQ